MLSRALMIIANLGAVALGASIAARNGGHTTSYLATFEGIPANVLPLLSTAAPPTPYQGLNWENAVVVKNAPAGQYVDDFQTTQGTQFIAVNTLSSIVFAVPDAGETFCLTSAYGGIYLSTDNSAAVPALDGVLAFTGTKLDGSKVTETVTYTATGTGIVKEAGVVLLGKSLAQKFTFSKLVDVTSVEVTVQSAALTDTVVSLLEALGLDLSSAVNAMALDSLAYEVTTPN